MHTNSVLNNDIRSISIRRMTENDIEGLMRLKNAEGWNQLEEDWNMILQYPENTCLVASVNNEIIASVTAIIYSGDIAWIGMMLVDKRYRGMGLGKQLMKEVIDKLKSCKSVKLDATDAGHPLYLKLGFKNEYTICRFVCYSIEYIKSKDIQMDILQMDSSSLPAVIEFDKNTFGTNRSDLIIQLYQRFPEYAWCAWKGKELMGFIMAREGFNYLQLGPLFAVSEEVASSLCFWTLGGMDHKPVLADIPLNKINLMQQLMCSGFNIQRFFTRMYLKNNPIVGNLSQQYLIGSPELG